MAFPQGFLSQILVATVVCCCVSTSAQMLPGHSISSIDAQKLATEWFMAGMVVPTLDTLVLSPGVPNRLGALWSMTPLLTNNFEVTLKLKGRQPGSRQTKDGGFAFWFTPTNGTSVEHPLFDNHAQSSYKIEHNTFLEEFKTAGCDLFGFKSQFEGLGVFFVDSTAGASMSAVLGDGSKAFKLGTDVPAADATKYDFLNDAEFTVKIAIQPDTAKVEIVGQPAVTVKGAFKSGGYIGLTSFGGEKLTPQSEDKSLYVQMSTLSVVNNDKSAKGEEVVATPPPPPPVPDDEKADLIAEASSFKDHRAESDAIKDLTNVIYKLVVESQPIRHSLEKAIGSMTKRVELMEKNFDELRRELDKKTHHHLAAEFEAIKMELTGLSNVASKETQERNSRVESLHADIADVHKSAHSPDNIDKHLDKLSQSNDRVLDQMTNEHQTMFGFSLAVIAFIVIAGLSLYNKFRCWEKKHVL